MLVLLITETSLKRICSAAAANKVVVCSGCVIAGDILVQLNTATRLSITAFPTVQFGQLL